MLEPTWLPGRGYICIKPTIFYATDLLSLSLLAHLPARHLGGPPPTVPSREARGHGGVGKTLTSARQGRWSRAQGLTGEEDPTSPRGRGKSPGAGGI